MHDATPGNPRPPYLKRIDCVNTLITRPSQTGPEVLLVWNSDWRPPGWSLPGGARECAEPLVDAAAREVFEETGLTVQVRSLLDVHEKIGLGGHVHLMVFTFSATVVGGSLISDGTCEPETGGVSSAEWVPLYRARKIPLVSRVLDLPAAEVDGVGCTCIHVGLTNRKMADAR
jgi:8-oxo-dGTP diphosphatase